MKKVIAFDLDGTLAPSKSPLPEEMSGLMSRLLDRFQVCVISGGRIEQFRKQLLNDLEASPTELAKLHLMPTCAPPLASTLSHRIAAAVCVPFAAAGSWAAYLPEAVILPRMVPDWRLPEARITVLRQ